MYMEQAFKNQEEYLEALKQKQQAKKGLEYQFLWVKISFSLTRGKHLKKLGAVAFVVFFAIRTYMNRKEISYPSLKRLADETGLSVKTVQKGITILTEKGWIKKIGRLKQKDGTFGNMQYKILQKDLVRGTGDQSFMKQPVE